MSLLGCHGHCGRRLSPQIVYPGGAIMRSASLRDHTYRPTPAFSALPCEQRISRARVVRVQSQLRRQNSQPQVENNQEWQSTLKGWTESKWYSWGFSGLVGLIVVSIQDAGYSGDWSRIGVLTHEQEALLRSVFIAVAIFHLVCTAASFQLISQKGLNKFYTAKVLIVGFPALLEVYLKDAKA